MTNPKRTTRNEQPATQRQPGPPRGQERIDRVGSTGPATTKPKRTQQREQPGPQPNPASACGPAAEDRVHPLFHQVPVADIVRVQVFTYQQGMGTEGYILVRTYERSGEALDTVTSDRIANDIGGGNYRVSARGNRGQILGWTTLHLEHCERRADHPAPQPTPPAPQRMDRSVRDVLTRVAECCRMLRALADSLQQLGQRDMLARRRPRMRTRSRRLRGIGSVLHRSRRLAPDHRRAS